MVEGEGAEVPMGTVVGEGRTEETMGTMGTMVWGGVGSQLLLHLYNNRLLI